MISKKPWYSKTMIAAAITALVPLYPPAAALVAANPALVMGVVGALFAGLRYISHGAITLDD